MSQQVQLKGRYISRFVKETGVGNLLLDRAPSESSTLST